MTIASVPAGTSDNTPAALDRVDVRARTAARSTLLNPTILGIELRRTLRNRRTLIFTLAFPVVMFLFISSQLSGTDDAIPGLATNVGAYIMVSMAVYGAIMATTSAGASVSIERAAGWSRQLRLTPLNPMAYVLTKMVTALVTSVLAVGVTFTVGALSGKAHIPNTWIWLECGAVIIVGSLAFAAFGLFMGYLLPAENAMQFLGPMLAILSILGGIFSGPIDPSSAYGQIAALTPIYGLGQLARWPLAVTTSGAHTPFELSWVINLVLWTALFVGGAAWRFRKDTARV